MRPHGPPAPRALLINGTVGAGKTSVADAVGELLGEAGVPHAVIDLDGLRRMWPSPAGDRFHFALLLRNLSSVAANYRDAGADRIVLAGVAETGEDRDRLREAVGADLAVCRLRVELPVVGQRLTRRHADDPEVLRWHLDRSGELDRILDHARTEDFTVDATHRTVVETAQAVIEAAGWRRTAAGS
ncbi:adenylyl-sulfate kinase [Streptomyces sp. NPDC101194]|uniref:adenylyl-sulfate kinase n=1 Tax=Streptomyces sp. NPDC101194 TaxID=3366127 RepID=UPI003830982F